MQSLSAGEGDAASGWVNITEGFTREIGVYDARHDYERRCLGMAVVPTGEIFIQTLTKGVCVSADQGGTWAVVQGNKITGRCATGFNFSIAYPYDGRLALFCQDGNGGITPDGGKTWKPFAKIIRSFEFADVDWGTREPKTIFGLLHEPFYTVLSTDGGNTWQHAYPSADALWATIRDQRFATNYCLGVIDATTLVRAHPAQGGIAMSVDAGKTWTEVSNYKVLGRRPVHYGKKVFWTTSEGVIVTTNGRDWSLTGKGPANAVHGPFFGASEQEFMVVSDKAFFLTKDGGKTWADVAPAFFPPDARTPGFSANALNNYFGWDPARNILYASSLGGSVYLLRVK
ncbi:MAG: hypothetical protein WC661_03305 [Opitutaceae bacterium]